MRRRPFLCALGETGGGELGRAVAEDDYAPDWGRIGSRAASAFAFGFANELLKNARISARDKSYIRGDLADAREAYEAALEALTDPNATPEQRAALARSAMDHADWASRRLEELAPFGAERVEAQRELERIAAEMKPIAESVSFDPFRLVEAPEWTGSAESAIMNAGARKGWVKPITTEKRQTQQGFEAFPSDDVLKNYMQQVKPEGDFFDVGMHGTVEGVCFGTKTPSMTARELARTILHDPGYRGQPVRLLSCDTGRVSDNSGYCVAEELANALGAAVIAPNDMLFIRSDGSYYVGFSGAGKMVEFLPNQRRRLK